MQRASVVLPLPDSPTRARQWCGRSVTSMPCRISWSPVLGLDVAHGDERLLVVAQAGPAARAAAVAEHGRAERGPPATPAAHAVQVVAWTVVGRDRGRALLDRVDAARREEAAPRAVAGPRRKAGDARSACAPLRSGWRRAAGACRGGSHASKSSSCRADLDQTPGVHHGDAVGEVGHDGEVVRDVDGCHLVGRVSSRTVSSTWAWVVTSRPVVGSSSTITLGRQAKAMARATRCCWPPES